MCKSAHRFTYISLTRFIVNSQSYNIVAIPLKYLVKNMIIPDFIHIALLGKAFHVTDYAYI